MKFILVLCALFAVLTHAKDAADLTADDTNGAPFGPAVVTGTAGLGESADNTKWVEDNQCHKSHKSSRTICRLYGETSKACKVVKEAYEQKSGEWGCSLDLGESMGNPATLTSCADFNRDTAAPYICQQAKVLCNVPKKDFCTDTLLKDCFASIGKGCPGTPVLPRLPTVVQAENQEEVDKEDTADKSKEAESEGQESPGDKDKSKEAESEGQESPGDKDDDRKLKPSLMTL